MEHFGFQVKSCPEEARGEALELVYRRVPAALRDRLILQVLDEHRRGEIDLSGLWIAQKRRGRIAGAMLTQPLAGKVAAVWAPEVRTTWRRGDLASALVKAALADFEARGFRLAQAILDDSAGLRAGRDLEKGGMPRITELLYLERDTATSLEPAVVTPRQVQMTPKSRVPEGFGSVTRRCAAFEWRPFEKVLEAEFRTVLQATYTGSLDMPELEGARSLDDILESHKAAGRFVAERWRLGRLPGDAQASAVLLLAEVPGRDVWEVIYLGLTQSVRGYGLGRAVLEHALELAGCQVAWLELAVDLRNTPALRLYASAGFVAHERRAVHLAIFPPSL
jgi:mycothiol synthase